MGLIGALIKYSIYLLAVLMVIAGLATALNIDGPYTLSLRLGGLAMFFAGLLVLPQVRGLLLSRYGIAVSGTLVAVVFITAVLGFGAVAPSSDAIEINQVEPEVNETHVGASVELYNPQANPIDVEVSGTLVVDGVNVSDATSEVSLPANTSRRYRVPVVALSGLSSAERSAVETGEFVIRVRIVDGEDTMTATPMVIGGVVSERLQMITRPVTV